MISFLLSTFIRVEEPVLEPVSFSWNRNRTRTRKWYAVVPHLCVPLTKDIIIMTQKGAVWCCLGILHSLLFLFVLLIYALICQHYWSMFLVLAALFRHTKNMLLKVVCYNTYIYMTWKAAKTLYLRTDIHYIVWHNKVQPTIPPFSALPFHRRHHYSSETFCISLRQ